MSTPEDNHVLAQLRAIRATVEKTHDDIGELRGRIGHIEEQSASMFGMYSTLSTRLDRFGERLDRIERRLELVDH